MPEKYLYTTTRKREKSVVLTASVTNLVFWGAKRNPILSCFASKKYFSR